MKDLKIYLVIASALLVVYLTAQYNRPKTIDWSETLCDTNKIPFGTYVMRNRLTDIFPGAKVKTLREPIYNVINDEHIQNGTYIIIANAVNLNKYDYEQLSKYIQKGNDVFIAASSFGRELYDTLGVAASQEPMRKSAIRIGFVNPALKDTLYDVDKQSSNGFFGWFDQSKAIVLGKNEFEDATYLKFKMGKGALFLNANPKMFTNYSLMQDMGTAYSSIALSFVGNNKNIVWDEYYSQGRPGSESLMRVFLNNDSLRWAFYIAFFALLFFVLYEMKRRQRIIPVIEPLKNSSVEFAGIVGQVYYEQRNNSNIAQKKAEYFLEHIRTAYHLRTNLFDDEFRNSLARKSGARPELIKILVGQIVNVRIGSHISDTELIDLNRNIEQFYIQAS